MPVTARNRLCALHRSLGIPQNYTEQRHLPFQTEATRLVSVGSAADDGKPVRLAPLAAAAWRRMRAAAAEDDIELLPLSGFRSFARLAKIIRRKLATGQTITAILEVVAAPGCSEHHTGRALDLASSDHLMLEVDFAKTPAFRWLKRRAGDFGFYLSYPRNNRFGIVYEPWHWCWVR